jgi:ArsR family transcriptional regulator
MEAREKKGPAMEELFAALADRTRLRIVNLMSGGEICVCYFVEILEESQPKISRHLAYLRRSGIVGARRDGKWMHYRLIEPATPEAAAVMQAIVAWLRSDPEMQRDRERLTSVCCSPVLPVSIQGAPLPVEITLSALD